MGSRRDIVRIVTTVAEMLSDRGEPCPGIAGMSSEDIENAVRGSVKHHTHIFDSGERFLVIFDNKTASGNIVSAADAIADDRKGRCVVVVRDESVTTLHMAKLYEQFGGDVEVFCKADLAFNISRTARTARTTRSR
jgi:K+-sensing histidine kinase KdpD